VSRQRESFSDSTFASHCHIDFERTHIELGLLMALVMRHLLAKETNA